MELPSIDFVSTKLFASADTSLMSFNDGLSFSSVGSDSFQLFCSSLIVCPFG